MNSTANVSKPSSWKDGVNQKIKHFSRLIFDRKELKKERLESFLKTQPIMHLMRLVELVTDIMIARLGHILFQGEQFRGVWIAGLCAYVLKRLSNGENILVADSISFETDGKFTLNGNAIGKSLNIESKQFVLMDAEWTPVSLSNIYANAGQLSSFAPGSHHIWILKQPIIEALMIVSKEPNAYVLSAAGGRKKSRKPGPVKTDRLVTVAGRKRAVYVGARGKQYVTLKGELVGLTELARRERKSGRVQGSEEPASRP